MTSPPRITVLTGAYDNEATLEAAMRSVLGQSVEDLELLVIDDGSTDGSRTVAERVAATDARVGVLTMPRNVGIARSLNAGLAEARAPVVAVLDADDLAGPERLERQLAVLDARPEVAVVGSRMREINPHGAELRSRTLPATGDVNAVLTRFNPIPNTSAAFRRAPVLAVGGYDPRYRYAMEYDLWLRLADAHVLHVLPETLSTRRMGGGNVAARAERAQHAEAVLILARDLCRRRTLRGAAGLAAPLAAWATPLGLKRALRRRLGQAE